MKKISEFTYKNNIRFIGELNQENYCVGWGAYTYPNNTYQIGIFESGWIKVGFSNTDNSAISKMGCFSNGTLHGYGLLDNGDNTFVYGIFEKGKPARNYFEILANGDWIFHKDVNSDPIIYSKSTNSLIVKRTGKIMELVFNIENQLFQFDFSAKFKSLILPDKASDFNYSTSKNTGFECITPEKNGMGVYQWDSDAIHVNNCIDGVRRGVGVARWSERDTVDVSYYINEKYEGLRLNVDYFNEKEDEGSYIEMSSNDKTCDGIAIYINNQTNIASVNLWENNKIIFRIVFDNDCFYFRDANGNDIYLDDEKSADNVQDVTKKTDDSTAKSDLSAIKADAVTASSVDGNKQEDDRDPMEELNELIGLHDVKEILDLYVAGFSRKEDGKKNLNMLFYGNPGTGKTVVARILGKILHKEGILPTDKFVECQSGDLIGKYVGATSSQASEIIDKAIGGVLFIDEAYNLYFGGEGAKGDFADQAIAVLLKKLEDNKGNICCIMAGYEDKMADLMHSNQGLVSRFLYTVDFPDYSVDELREIIKLQIKKFKYNISESALELLMKYVAYIINDVHFSNARTTRNIVETVILYQNRRTKGTKPLSYDIEDEDVLSYFKRNKFDVEKAEKKDNNIELPSISYIEKLHKEKEMLPFEKNIDVIKESIVALSCSTGQGSGFIISPDGYIISNEHVVKGNDYMDVYLTVIDNKNQERKIKRKAKVLAVDEKNDVSCLKILPENDMKEEYSYLAIYNHNEIPDSKVNKIAVVGYPFGYSRFQNISITRGYISSRQVAYNRNVLNLDVEGKSGSSGSCVIDCETGKVIGIYTGAHLHYSPQLVQDINFCIDHNYIWDILKKDN